MEDADRSKAARIYIESPIVYGSVRAHSSLFSLSLSLFPFFPTGRVTGSCSQLRATLSALYNRSGRGSGDVDNE